MSSKYAINNSSNTTSNSTKYKYQVKKVLLEGSVILCQHGFLGTEETLNPLFDNLKNNVFNKFYNCEFCDGIMRATELNNSNSTLKEIIDKHEARPKSNIFVRTLFSNPTYGAVSTQASELRDMINLVRRKYPNIPIVLIGYSKGGVVNCKCAINNPGLIDKIVNVGTPHDETLIQDLIQILGDSLKKKYGSFLGIPIKPVRDAIQYLVDLANSGVDSILNETVTYTKLREEWNNLLIKPKFTPIAGEAIVVNGEFNGDFIVPTESAIANGFRGRTYLDIINNFIVTDDRVTISTNKLKGYLGNASCVLDILSKFSEVIIGGDIVKTIEALFDIILNILQNDGDFSKCLKLAHTSFLGSKDFLLTHNTIGMRVLAGINA